MKILIVSLHVRRSAQAVALAAGNLKAALPQELQQNTRLLDLYLDQSQGINVTRSRGSNFTYLGLNMQSKRLANPLVRQALAHALNKKEIIQFLFQESARPANTLLSDDHWASNTELEAYKHDPQLARELLRQAGYDRDSPLELSYKTSNDPFRIRLATVIQSQLEAVGVEIDIRSYDWGTFYGDIKSGRFQL
ncbi:MAG: ABC transporter substrate-binding protein, partial [Geopsychrobacter sp.]|nr:ABC transporter substrate-binding protein [Geopsychrobacter sp.]